MNKKHNHKSYKQRELEAFGYTSTKELQQQQCGENWIESEQIFGINETLKRD